MAKTVHLIRHGQSIDNASAVFQGNHSQLSELGVRQAQQVAQRLSGVAIDALVSSPLRRAEQTAQYIGSVLDLQPEHIDTFVERIKPSAISGKPHTDEVAHSIWRDWNKSLYTPNLRIQDGENYEDIMLRSQQALDQLTARPEDTVAVVSHGYFLRSMVAQVMLGPALHAASFEQMHRTSEIHNASITTISYEDAFEEDFRWRLTTYNDINHLD